MRSNGISILHYAEPALLAKRFKLDEMSLGYYLKEAGTLVLAIPILGLGRALSGALRSQKIAPYLRIQRAEYLRS